MTIPDDERYYDNDGQPPEEPGEQPAYSQADEPKVPQPLSDDELPYLPGEDTQPYLSDGESLPFQPAEEEPQDFDFSRMEDDVAAFHRELNELKPPSPESILEDEPASDPSQPTRRRRRTVRITERLDATDLGERLESIVQRASPSVDFFVFSLVSACILGIGYMLDAPAILLIGIFVTPVLGPLVGAALSAATGETRLFRLTFGGFLIGLAMVFIIAILAGLISRFIQPLTFSQAFYHARLWWPDLLMLVIGTAILVISFIQSEDKPVIPSLMVAYQIFLPASAAGFGLGSGIQGLWPQAGLVFLIHLALVLIISLIIFFYMGFRPTESNGYTLTAVLFLAGILILGGFAGLGSLINVRGDQAYATALAAPTATNEVSVSETPAAVKAAPTLKPTLSTASKPSLTPPPPTSTRLVYTATVQFTPTIGVTPDVTLLPTAVYGRVQSPSGGLMVRVTPGGKSITTVQNGYLAQIMSDTPIVIDGATWVHVIITTPNRDIDGWVLLSLIVTATPSFSP